jgi:hypothetical protein
MSPVSATSTIAAGRRPISPRNTVRLASYPGSPGPITLRFKARRISASVLESTVIGILLRMAARPGALREGAG